MVTSKMKMMTLALSAALCGGLVHAVGEGGVYIKKAATAPVALAQRLTLQFDDASQLAATAQLPAYTDTSTYFVATDAAVGPLTGIWTSGATPTTVTIYATGSDGVRKPVYLQVTKSVPGGGGYAMNSGIYTQAGLGASSISFMFEAWRNPQLTSGIRYVTAEADAVKIEGRAWHRAGSPVLKTFTVGVNVLANAIAPTPVNVTYGDGFKYQEPSGYGLPVLTDTSTYFVARDAAVGPTQGVWVGGEPTSKLKIYANGSDGSRIPVYVRAARNSINAKANVSGFGVYSMNSGVYTSYGLNDSALLLSIDKIDNPQLRLGVRYITSEADQVLVDARAWHRPGSPILATLKVGVDVDMIPPAPPPETAQIGAYFAQWGIYERNYNVKDVVTSGTASKLTFLNYGFGNIYKDTDGYYRCKSGISKAETGEGDGGDAYADYGKGFDASNSVDGVADVWQQPLRGNFNQLKKLKKAYPDIKTLISLGGWTWSKNFSAAASLQAYRTELVKSCLDVYIKGNLASTPDAPGGVGIANGVFDGIDIDWEFPGGGGLEGTPFSAEDGVAYTSLLKEFREQLDALGKTTGKTYLLTTALSPGVDKLAHIEPQYFSRYVNWANLMAYDLHGAWETKTGHQSSVFLGNDSPYANDPLLKNYNLNSAVQKLKTDGMPMNKLTLGVPLYGRGWNAPAGATHGLYQTSTSIPAPVYAGDLGGVKDYKLLRGKGTYYYDDAAQAGWSYDGTSMWSYDDPKVVVWKVAFAKRLGLAGMFGWELDGDYNGELMNAVGKFAK